MEKEDRETLAAMVRILHGPESRYRRSLQHYRFTNATPRLETVVNGEKGAPPFCFCRHCGEAVERDKVLDAWVHRWSGFICCSLPLGGGGAS